MSEAEQKVSDTITVKVDGKDREIFMSFALLNKCCAMVGDPDNIELIALNPDLRQAILEEVYSPRDEKGKKLSEAKMDEIQVSFSDIEATLDWVTEHVLNFTLSALERAAKRKGKNDPKLSALMATLLGANNSNSPKSAA